VLGMTGGLTTVGLSLRENIPVEAQIGARVLLPFFDFPTPLEMTISIGIDGAVTATLSGGTALVSLDRPGLAKLDIKSLTVGVEHGKVFTALSGALTPKVAALGGLQWPTFDIKELRIDSSGHVSVAGGWIDLPGQKSFSLYGFTVEITKIGFGTQDDGKRWIGFSGGVSLVSGIKAGASVEGLRILFTDLHSIPTLSLEGAGIDFEIPDAIAVTGSVSLTEKDFSGAVKVVIESISLTIDGQFVTGRTDQGDRYFGIFVHGELPAGIPLGATGLAIYGLAGLYGQNLAPGKRSDEDWFENPDGSKGWYERDPVGIDDLRNKWAPTSGAFALGAGITLGTYTDNGYEFSGRLLLVISFPGPTILIDGRANLFKKRAELSGSDPTFRALAVIQPGQSLLLGLDAHYKYKDDGELLDIKGSAEAFFDYTDARNWHIFLGRKDPQLNRRIAARIFKLFDVNGYFELTPANLQVGAGWSFDKSYGFSSLNVHVQASMQTDATVSWHPNHFTGSVILDGGAELRAFGHGVGVHAHADITGDVFAPFHLKGSFHVGIDLPWPLPDIGGTVNLEWQETLDSTPPLPLPLREATVEHTKRMLKWPIPRAGAGGALLPNNNGGGDLELRGDQPIPVAPDDRNAVPGAAPRIPADSAIGLTFSRPISDDSQIGVNPTGVDKEIIGDPTSPQSRPKGAFTVQYKLSSVTLEKRVPAPESVSNLNDLGPRWVQVAEAHGSQDIPGQQQLFGAWSPAPANDSDPSANSEQLKLLINAKTPFDYTAQQLQLWDDWIDSPANAGYPCQPPASLDPNQQFCATFIGLSALGQTNEIDFDNPAFSVIWQDSAELTDSDTNVPGGGGSKRSLGLVGQLQPGNEVQVIPPSGLNEAQLRVGTVQVLARLVTTFPVEGQAQGNTLTLDTAVLTVFETSDPDADLVPGPGPNKTPLQITIANGGLDGGNLTEITFPPATAALNVDVDVGVLSGPDSDGTPNRADLIAFTDTGVRQVTALSLGRQGFRVRLTGVRIVRVAIRTGGTLGAHIFRVHARTPVSATAVSRDGSEVFGPFEEVDGLIRVVGDDLGLIELGTPRRCEFTLMELCTPNRRLELNRHTISSLDLLGEEDAIFDPQADYRLVVTTRRNDHAVQGNNDAANVNEDIKIVEQAYFHVVGPPGIEVPDKPATPPPAAGSNEGNATGFEDLRFYLKSTVPDTTPASDGKPVIPRAFYRAYDVSMAFDEPSSVEKMYRLAHRDLTLRLCDTANNPVLDADGRAIVPTARWDTAQQPTLTDAQKRWVRMVNAAACRPSDIPLFDVTHAKTDQLVSAPVEELLLPETLYQARLVPALLHEAFVNAIPGLAADGVHELERWIAVNDSAAAPGRWIVGSGDVIGPDGNPVIGADGRHVQTFFATETTGHNTTLLYRGPLGAPADGNAPGNWSDFRASFQFRWAGGTVAIRLRYASQANFVTIAFDRNSGARIVLAVINGVQTVLSSDQPDLGGTQTDLVVSVDCVGDRLRVTQTGAPALDLRLPAGSSAAGTVGFFGSFAAGCRFTEIRVDDLRPNPATAERLDFITSKYANFVHHLGSFDDQVFDAPAGLGLTAADLTANLAAAVAIPAGGPPGFGPGPISEPEKRAFDALELATLGPDGRLRPPAVVEISRASHDPALTVLLIRSPEPLVWERTSPVVAVPPAAPKVGVIPGVLKMLGVSFGATPAAEQVTVLVRARGSLTGFAIEWRHVQDGSNPSLDWTRYFTFGAEPAVEEGTAVVISSGSSADAPARQPGTAQRFVAADAASAALRFPTDGTGVELRLLDATGAVVHQREFRPDGGFTQIATNIVRKADGTALFLLLPPGSTPPAGMRIALTFARNLGPTSELAILRQAGSETPEVAVLDFALQAV
jgi:hypothetical protein